MEPNGGVQPIGCHDKFLHIVKQNLIDSARIACLFVLLWIALPSPRALIIELKMADDTNSGSIILPEFVSIHNMLLSQKIYCTFLSQ